MIECFQILNVTKTRMQGQTDGQHRGLFLWISLSV